MSDSRIWCLSRKKIRLRYSGGKMEAFAELMLLGMRVREVRSLHEEAIWLPDRRLLLIDQALTQSRRQKVAARLLAEAARVGQ